MSAHPLTLNWVDDPAFWSANRAQHAFAGDYELIAYDLPTVGTAEARIGWEIYIGPDHSQLAKADEAADFDAAKAAAEKAWEKMLDEV
ncbi:hypothetical protein [Sphingobium yanoikuyae]|uniref:Uncharacterized protein n=1 Tax=Sphingobium yanoikuyae TaxID=13690 RepID=A0A291N0A1_SPHYA|nr:hypothetical protein [Sphingobium yanoikuyae]ATI80756.1 hypothetical protein A6768_12645 [Sphingobium yanoikuyae]